MLPLSDVKTTEILFSFFVKRYDPFKKPLSLGGAGYKKVCQRREKQTQRALMAPLPFDSAEEIELLQLNYTKSRFT